MLDFDDLIADVQHEAPQHTMASINVRSYETFKWMGTFHSSFLKMLRDDIETLKM